MLQIVGFPLHFFIFIYSHNDSVGMEEVQEEPQQEQLMENDGFVVSPKQDPDLTKWQLSPEDIISELKHDLRGEFYDKDAKQWLRYSNSEPMLNEAGINAVISVVKLYVNRNSILTDLDEYMVESITKNVNVDIAKLFFNKYKEFKIDKNYLTILVDKIVWFVYFSLRRAWEGGERRFLTETKRTSEIIHQNQEQKKGFGGLFGGK